MSKTEAARELCRNLVLAMMNLADRTEWQANARAQEWAVVDYEVPNLRPVYQQALDLLGYQQGRDDHKNHFLPGTSAVPDFTVWGAKLTLPPDFPGERRNGLLRAALTMAFGEIGLALVAINHFADETCEPEDPDDIREAMAALHELIKQSREAVAAMADPYPEEDCARQQQSLALLAKLSAQVPIIDRTWKAVQGEPAPDFGKFREYLLEGYLPMWARALWMAQQMVELVS